MTRTTETIVTEVLEQVEKWFHEYADKHVAQGKTGKSERNRQRAEYCAKALAEIRAMQEAPTLGWSAESLTPIGPPGWGAPDLSSNIAAGNTVEAPTFTQAEVEAAVAAEREACAQIFDAHAKAARDRLSDLGDLRDRGYQITFAKMSQAVDTVKWWERSATAIRNRSTKETSDDQ